MSGLAWMPDARTPLSRAAAACAAHGMAIFPCNGKLPRTAHGMLDATTDAETVAAWWRRWPDASIGWRIPEGLVVLDIDARHRGHESLADLEREHGRLPKTLTAVTGGGGLHIVLRMPAGIEARQLAGIRDGIDTRTSKGYIITAPSLHASGLRYAWHDRVRVADAPGWLAELVRVPAPVPTPYAPAVTAPGDTGRRERYARAALEGEARAVAATAEGGRNHRLFAAWARCTRDAAVAPFVPRNLVVCELTRAARAAGLPDVEILRTLR